MLSISTRWWYAIAPLLLSSAALAAPTAVSPGGRETPTAVASACPTFSWAGSPGATGYELLIYPVDDGVIGRKPLLRKRIPVAANSWTPALAECLRGGSSFAWAVRAVAGTGDAKGEDAKGVSVSEPLFFSTPAAPTAEDVARALEILQQWRASRAPLGAIAKGIPQPSSPVTPGVSTPSAGGPSVAVTGANTDGGGSVGVLGSSASSDNGTVGVFAQATSTTGDVFGLFAEDDSTAGAAAALYAPAGGDLLRGFGPSELVLKVDSAGVVTANGSGLTHVDAETLGGHASSYYTSGSQVMPNVLANDGSGSNLDADLVDGLDSTAFVKRAGDTMTGDLSTSGNYLWTSERTYYQSISPAAFSEENNSYVTSGRQWGRGANADYLTVGGAATFPNSTTFIAPLQLPNGASILSFTLYAYDADASANATFTMLPGRRNLSSTSIQSLCFGGGAISLGPTAGSSTSIQSASCTATTFASTNVVDNQQYDYYLVATVVLDTAASTNLRFYGVQVAYTLQGPSN